MQDSTSPMGEYLGLDVETEAELLYTDCAYWVVVSVSRGEGKGCFNPFITEVSKNLCEQTKFCSFCKPFSRSYSAGPRLL